MKKLIAVPVIALLLFAGSCKKNNPQIDTSCRYFQSSIVAPLSEQQALQDSLNAYGIQATKDSTGFFYIVNNPGTGSGDTSLCSAVAVNYRGSFFNGKGFDSTSGNPAAFYLFQVIGGWQKGIPLVGKSGSITLYIPPSLGYGDQDTKDNNGNIVIPANSYLVFQVGVVDIQYAQ